MIDTEDETLAEHDAQYHPGGFDPEAQTCSVRTRMEKDDNVDSAIKGNSISVKTVQLYGITEDENNKAKKFITDARNGTRADKDTREIICKHAPSIVAVCATITFRGAQKFEDVPLSFTQKMFNADEHTEHQYSDNDLSHLLEKIANPIAVLKPTGTHQDVMRFIVDSEDTAFYHKEEHKNEKNSKLSCACVFYDDKNKTFVINTMYGIGVDEYKGQKNCALYVNTDRSKDLSLLGIDANAPATQKLFKKEELSLSDNVNTSRRTARVEIVEKEKKQEKVPKDEAVAFAFKNRKKMFSRLEEAMKDIPEDVRKLCEKDVSIDNILKQKEDIDKIKTRIGESYDEEKAKWMRWYTQFSRAYNAIRGEYNLYLRRFANSASLNK